MIRWSARIAACCLCFASPALGQQEEVDAWQKVVFGETDKERALYLFGIPDSVRAHMTWPEYLAFEASPRTLDDACFVYLPLRPGLAALKGPLGTAATAEICFQANRLSSIEWNYSGDQKASAHTSWLRTDKSRLRLAGKLLTSSRELKNGTLFVLCGVGASPPACEAEITARLQRTDAR